MIMHFRIRNWDRLVGLFAILALLILIATLVFMAWGQNWFEKRYHYRAAFAKVQGLKPGTPVTISGMEVGSVNSSAWIPRERWKSIWRSWRPTGNISAPIPRSPSPPPSWAGKRLRSAWARPDSPPPPKGRSSPPRNPGSFRT